MEEMVVEALLFGDRQAQLLAARQLGQFSSKQRHKIVEKGIVPPLILMLSTDDYEAIEAALFALLSIAFRSERLACAYFIQERVWYVGSHFREKCMKTFLMENDFCCIKHSQKKFVFDQFLRNTSVSIPV